MQEECRLTEYALHLGLFQIPLHSPVILSEGINSLKVTCNNAVFIRPGFQAIVTRLLSRAI